MADAEAEAAGAAAETKRKETTEASVEEAMVDKVAEEEAKEATTTTTMQDKAVATSMEAEAAEGTTMGTTTTSIRGINITHSCISNNQCLQKFHYPIQRPVQHHIFRTTTWTATPIRPVTMLTVANEATKGNTGRDQPNLVQRVSLQ